MKKFLGGCVKTEMKEETLDLSDPVVRKEVIDKGFTATSDRRWQ